MRSLIISFLGLFLFVSPIKAEDLVQRTAVSAIEAEKFFKDWPRYQEWLEEEEINDMAGLNDNLNSAYQYSEEEIEWANKNEWSIDRFFYVKNRIISIIRSVHMKRENDKIVKMLKKQRQTTERNSSLPEKTKKSLLRELDASIERKSQIPLLEGITMGEYELIEPNIDAVMQTMGF